MDILTLDESLFRAINIDGHSLFLDYFLPFIRNKYFWGPLYLFAISFLIINFKKQGLFFLLGLFITITIADTLSSKVLKPAVERIRPCNQKALGPEVKLLVHCGGGYSFPSSHATNHFAAALFFILGLGKRIKGLAIPLVLWAGLISFAQVYVGVHFPLDIFAGAVLGSIVAWVVSKLQYQVGKTWDLNIKAV